MYCNILHALDPSPNALGGYADQLFQAVLSHAQSVQMTSTTVFTDATDATGETGETGETAHQWLHDAMATVIQATLDNDQSLDSTVRNDLLQDLQVLQTELGIDKTQDATTKTRLVIAETNILAANAAKWMTSTFTGIAKLGGLFCASLAGWIYDRAAQAAPQLSPKTILAMRGVSVLSLVSSNLATVLCASQNLQRGVIWLIDTT
jgi:hypothetical protein